MSTTPNKNMGNEDENDEREMEYFSKNGRIDSGKRQQGFSEFYKINRRITHGLCIPMLKNNDIVNYCSFAKMPGMWLASCVRYEKKDQICKRRPKASSKTKQTYYNRQEHVVKSCLRQLLRQEFEKFLGRCKYSMTSYKDLLRLSVPSGVDFMVILNVEKSILDKFTELLPENYLPKGKELDDLHCKCEEKLNICLNEKMPTDEIIKDIFHEQEFSPELKALFEKYCKLQPRIRYAIIGAVDTNYPLVRYVRKGMDLLLSQYDEFEFFIESISGFKMRQSVEDFFDETDFNLSVYEKAAILSVPIGKNFFALISLDNKMNADEALYFPPEVNNIINFIEDRIKEEYITTGL